MSFDLRAPLSTWILTVVNLLLGMGLWIFGLGNNGTSHWEPSPNGRGTWSILTTCIITLSLCVYTALHLNIPAYKSSPAVTYGMKVKYVLIGLLAPEVIVYNAWRQRTAAASLVAYIRKARGGRKVLAMNQQITRAFRSWIRASIAAVKGKPLRHVLQLLRDEGETRLPWEAVEDPWKKLTLYHGFYITMGGYSLDFSGTNQPRIWPEGVDRLAISPKAVAACLASEDPDLRSFIPFISKREIWDKSKANGLAKMIVCIQALWFMIQVIGRLAQGYPISLLELNTFAHALCALLVYLLWWDKPLDIEQPTVIRTADSEIATDICIMSWSGVQGPVEHFKIEFDVLGRLWERIVIRLWYEIGAASSGFPSDSMLLSSKATESNGQRPKKRVLIAGIEKSDIPISKDPGFTGLTTEEQSQCTWVSSFPPVFSVNMGETIPGTNLFVHPQWDSIQVDEIFYRRIKMMERLRASQRWMTYDKALRPVLNIDDKDLVMLKPRELNFSDSLMRNSFEDATPVSHNLNATIGIILSGVIYGALHMLAWGSSTFQNQAEQIIWIVACCTIALGGLLVFLGIWVLDKVSNLDLTVYGITFQRLLLYISAPGGIVIGLLYAASRVYLVVEVFRNLAYLDPAIYTSPDWPIYFPHIT